MLSSVITYLNERIETLGYIPFNYGLVERIRIDGKECPAKYCNNEWTQLTDFTPGFVYHRIIGAISSEDVLEEETVSCEPYEKKTFPMRLVFSKNKSEFTNDSFTNERIANELSSIIKVRSSKDLCISLGVDVVEVIPDSTDINIYDVFDGEWKGFDNLPLNCVLISVDYEISIQGQVSCFERICTIV